MIIQLIFSHLLNTINTFDSDIDEDDSSSSDSDSSDSECGDYKDKTIAIIFSGIDVTIPSTLLSLVMSGLFMTALFKIKK